MYFHTLFNKLGNILVYIYFLYNYKWVFDYNTGMFLYGNHIQWSTQTVNIGRNKKTYFGIMKTAYWIPLKHS